MVNHNCCLQLLSKSCETEIGTYSRREPSVIVTALVGALADPNASARRTLVTFTEVSARSDSWLGRR